MTTATATQVDGSRLVVAWLEGNEAATVAAPARNPYPTGWAADAWLRGFYDRPLPGFFDDEPTVTLTPVAPTTGQHDFDRVAAPVTVEQILARFPYRSGVPVHRRAAWPGA